MTIQHATSSEANVTNGVDVDQVLGLIGAVEADPEMGKFHFRAKNRWVKGGLNQSSVKDFYAAGREDDTRTEAFVLDADEPELLAGNDSAPNPVEFILHALAACLTTTMVYHAAVRGIVIEAVESQLEGDIDVRGFLGLSQDVRKGYHNVRVRMRVKSEASAQELKELATYSPVYDTVSNSLPVDLVIETT